MCIRDRAWTACASAARKKNKAQEEIRFSRCKMAAMLSVHEYALPEKRTPGAGKNHRTGSRTPKKPKRQLNPSGQRFIAEHIRASTPASNHLSKSYIGTTNSPEKRTPTSRPHCTSTTKSPSNVNSWTRRPSAWSRRQQSQDRGVSARTRR